MNISDSGHAAILDFARDATSNQYFLIGLVLVPFTPATDALVTSINGTNIVRCKLWSRATL
jgi:hypothetical protein